jgi:hypothetical protein
MAVGRTNASAKGGGVDLSIVYSDTQPPTDAGELWVKDSAAAKSVYVTPYAELANYVVTEDTGCVNTTRLYCAGAGSYNGKIYWIAWSGSLYGSAKLSLYSYNPQTNAVTAELSNFFTMSAYQNMSNVIAAELKGNKFFVASSGPDLRLAVLDIDTLVYTINTNAEILNNDNSSYTNSRYDFGLSADGSKLYSGGNDSKYLYVYDTITKTSTTYYGKVGKNPQYFFDDGTYIYIIHGYDNKAISVLRSSNFDVVTTTSALPGYVRACFMVGGSIYIGIGPTSIYKLEYNGNAISFVHVSDSAPEWAESTAYNSAQKYGDLFGTVGQYTHSAYAAIGDTLYCICAGGSGISSNDVPIKRVKFSAAAYAHDALIVTTTGAPKNRTKLVTSDGFNVKINVNKLYKTDNAGNMTEVDGYSKNLAGEWVKI